MNKLPLLILRELIVSFDDYKLILIIKLLNKRFYNFINNDKVCQERYLKLKYDLEFNLNDNVNLSKLISVIDSKFYSHLLKRGLDSNFNKVAFINPYCDSVILLIDPHPENVFVIISSKNNLTLNLLTDLISNNNRELIEKSLFSEGYFILKDEESKIFYDGVESWNFSKVNHKCETVELNKEFDILQFKYEDNFDKIFLECLKTLI